MPKDSLSIPLPAPARRAKIPLSRPLRHALYRKLWMANMVSNLGTWTQTFASAWLIASLAQAASTATLVQTASYLPIFLFAPFAGAVADGVHPPKFLFLVNLFMSLCACAMAALVMSGHASAWPVLALTFCLGTGNAFMWPAWQASMSSLVQADELEAAATLGNLSYNLAAVLGPALGGLLFGWIGAGPLFLVNALSFVGLLHIYWTWWRTSPPFGARPVAIWSSLKDGVSAAAGSARFRFILRHVGTAFFTTIAFPSLLPLFVRDVLHMESRTYGMLMGCMGGGAVIAAFLLPTLRARLERTTLLASAMLLYGAMLVTMPALRSLWTLVPLILAGGMAWSGIVSTLNAAAQASFPPEIRARTLALYLFVMAAGYTVGSLFWGRLADHVGLPATLTVAGACMIVNAAALATGKRKSPL